MQHLDYNGRKSLSIYILNNALENEIIIPTPDETEQALTLLTTLVTEKNENLVGEIDMEELAEEQCLLARFVHQLQSDVPDEQYLILTVAKKVCLCYITIRSISYIIFQILVTGGAARIKYTLPPLIFQAYQLAYKYKATKEEKWDKKCTKIFQFCHQTITSLVKAELAELPLRLFLQGALAIDQIGKFHFHWLIYHHKNIFLL